MDRAILDEIADQLDGTDDSLSELLDDMGLSTSAFKVEAELERRLGFGYCQGCALWGDGVQNGRCDLCDEDDAIW